MAAASPACNHFGVATVGLMALDADVAEVLAAALRDEGYDTRWITFGPDVLRLLQRHGVDVLVLDAHEFVNTKHLLAAIRAYPATAALHVVVLGPARPLEVPDLPGVAKLGPRFDLHAILDAVRRAA